MENIKDGDIITLENGDIVKISLTKIGEKITNITPTRKYKLKHSGEFCHTISRTSGELTKFNGKDETWIYIGEVMTTAGNRHIFYHDMPSTYCMFATNNLDFVACEVIE